MMSKIEHRELTKLFWTSYGKYMKKHTPRFGKKTKWTNYKTLVKDVYFRLRVGKKSAEIAIEIQHSDVEIQALFYEQFEEFKRLFNDLVGSWIWEDTVYNEFGVKLSKISMKINEVSLYNKNTWKDIFLFFEENQVKLDEFWSEFADVFIDLEA